MVKSKQVMPTYVTIEGSHDDIAHDLKQFIIWHDQLKQENEILKKTLEEIKESYIFGQPNHEGEVMVEIEDTCDAMYQIAVDATVALEKKKH